MMTAQTVRTTYLALIGLYVLVMIWVWSGVFYYTGIEYAGLAAILAVSFVTTAAVCYFVIVPLLRPLAEFDVPISPGLVTNLVIGIIIALIILHWVIIGHIPILTAYEKEEILQAKLVREGIDKISIPLINYIPMIIKSTIPFMIIYSLSVKRYTLSWLSVFLGLVYGISLMHRAYPLFMLVPPFIYCFFTGQFMRGGVIITLAVAAVPVVMIGGNPTLRPSFPTELTQESDLTQESGSAPISKKQEGTAESRTGQPQPPAQGPTAASAEDGPAVTYSTMEKIERLLQGLENRVLLVPGYVVANWFKAFPAELPYEHGCGYRFLSPLIGCSFKPNPSIVYAHYYPENVAKGLNGSMNASHFAEEYANFGPPGLLLSGFLVAGVLAAAALASARAGLAIAISINFPFVMSVSSKALHTTLLSGGWFLMMLLVMVFFSHKKGHISKTQEALAT